jgi:hypothetical protein
MEKIPKGYKIKYRLKNSPMNGYYILICEKKDEIAIFKFDGISDFPIVIETYYKAKLSTN